MNYIRDIDLHKKSNSYMGIIEIPKGTNEKFELVEPTFDKVKCIRKVKGKYPFYYGCFPQTLAGDRDALDMVLLSNKKRFKLDYIETTPIGVIKTIDDGEQDDKILVVDSHEILSDSCLSKLKKRALKFLKKYKGRKSKMILDTTIYDKNEAIQIIENCYNTYRRMEIPSIKINF